VVDTRYGGKWAWLAGRNGPVRLDWGESIVVELNSQCLYTETHSPDRLLYLDH